MADTAVQLPPGYQLDQAPQPPDGYTLDERPVYSTTVTAEQPKGSALSRFAGGVWNQAKNAAVGIAKLAPPVSLGIDAYHALSAMAKGQKAPDAELIQMAKGVAAAHYEQGRKAMQSFDQGKYSEGAGHLLATILPFVGPAAADIGDQIGGTDAQLDKFGNVVKPGKAPDIAGGLGEGAGLIGTMLAPEAVGKGVSKLNDVSVIPKLGNRNPTEAAALDYLDQAGVPVSAGVRTGNAFVRGAEKLTDHTPLGSMVAANAERTATEALRAEAARLVDRAKPEVPSSQGYSAFEKAAENRSTWREVPTGRTLEIPARESKVLDASGQPMNRTAPASIESTERMPMPVRIGDLRDLMGKVVDDFELASGIDRNSSAAYSVAKQFADGPEYAPAPTAEKALSALKELARTGEGVGAGTAKMLIPKLQDLIDGSVRKYASPAVMDALRTARKSAAAEVGVDWFEKAFTKAQTEGGMNHAAAIWNDWNRLTPDAKGRIFRNPRLIEDANKFFLGWKKLAENPNASGSGYIAAIAGESGAASGLLLTGHWLAAAGMVLPPYAIAKMLHSPAASRALTNGIRISLDKAAPAAAKAAAAGNILRLAGDLAQPVETVKAAQSNDPSQQTAMPATILPPQ